MGPHLLPENKDGTYVLGDNQNSWIGVALLQEIFLKEHNWIADQMASKYPDMSDQKIFDAARLTIAALVAKIHTVDWTVELLRTRLLIAGMYTNWWGILYGLSTVLKPLPFLKKFNFLALVGKTSENYG